MNLLPHLLFLFVPVALIAVAGVHEFYAERGDKR